MRSTLARLVLLALVIVAMPCGEGLAKGKANRYQPYQYTFNRGRTNGSSTYQRPKMYTPRPHTPPTVAEKFGDPSRSGRSTRVRQHSRGSPSIPKTGNTFCDEHPWLGNCRPEALRNPNIP